MGSLRWVNWGGFFWSGDQFFLQIGLGNFQFVYVAVASPLRMAMSSQVAIKPKTTKPLTGPTISPAVNGTPASLWKIVLKIIWGARRTTSVRRGAAIT